MAGKRHTLAGTFSLSTSLALYLNFYLNLSLTSGPEIGWKGALLSCSLSGLVVKVNKSQPCKDIFHQQSGSLWVLFLPFLDQSTVYLFQRHPDLLPSGSPHACCVATQS